MQLAAGDMISIRKHRLAGEQYPADRQFSGSHVAMALGANMIIQGLTTVQKGWASDILKGAGAAWRIRYLPRTIDQCVTLVRLASHCSGKTYGYADLLPQLADATLKTRWFTRHIGSTFLKHFPSCSFVAAEPYEAIGIRFGGNDWSTTPADIYRCALKHPEEFSVEQIH
jgi:hypothetical protein